MIHISIRGRHGNQMFQYVLARVLQEKTGEMISFNRSYQLKNMPSYDSTSLEQYVLGGNFEFEDEKRFPWYADLGCPLIKAARKFFPQITFRILSKFNVFIWLGTTYVDIKYQEGKDMYLDGLWQCEKYFDKMKPQLLKELTPKKPVSAHNREFLERIQSTEAVCISTRRGDYLSLEKVRKALYVCDVSYYERSIAEMSKQVPNATWFVFSDDIEWTKAALSFPSDMHYEDGKDSVSEKLFLMSKCKHFILSNSTFSWWAQYLSEEKNKTVIAPDKWFVDGRKTDIYDESWIRIPV